MDKIKYELVKKPKNLVSQLPSGNINEISETINYKSNKIMNYSEFYKILRNFKKEKETKSYNDCSICLDCVSGKIRSKCDVCSAEFHGRCIKKWFKKEPTCPNCRVVIQKKKYFKEKEKYLREL